MKKHVLTTIFTILILTGAAPLARAACTLGAGSICIQLQDQFGNAIIGDAGTTVDVVTEGFNGNILVPPFGLWNNLADGGVDDEDGAADGDVEIAAASLAGTIDPAGFNDWYYSVESTSGYVNVTSGFLEYDAAGVNTQTTALLFTLKVTVTSQAPIGAVIDTGATVDITNTTSCNGSYTDNGVSDMDGGTIDGEVYLKCPVGGVADSVTATVTPTGYLQAVDNSQSLTNASQITVTSVNDFPFTISAQDQFGTALTLTAAASALGGGLTTIDLKDSAGAMYWAATGGPNDVTLTVTGFITGTTNAFSGPYTYAAAGVQQAIAFDNATGEQLDYSLVVIGATDELGTDFGALDAAGATFSATGFSVVTSVANAGDIYIAGTAVAGNLSISIDGYEDASVAVTPNTAAQQDIDFDSAAEFAAAVDGPPLNFAYLITGVTTEVLAADLTGTITALTCGDASGSNACTPSGGAWYCPVVLANSDGTLQCTPTQDGYVEEALNMDAGTTRTTGSDAQVSDTVSNVKYAQKYTMTTEAIGAVFTGALVTLAGGGASCTEDGATGVYYCDYVLADDNAAGISSVLDGYVDDQATNLSTDRTANTDAQDAQTLSIKYSHKITTISTEALIDNIAADVTSLTVGGDTCTWHAGTTAWYCVTLLANDNVALSADVTLDGYVNASYGAVGNRVANTDAQSVDAITDVEYSHRVNTITTEQLLANIEGAGATLTIGGTACTWDGVTTAYYCPVLLAGDDVALSAAVTLDGYVQASYGTVGDRTANGDAQSVDAITDVQYSHIVTTISTEVFATNIAGAGTTLTIGGDACTWFAFSSTYYCAVALANDDVAASAQATLDGYVQASFGTVANRTANADAQVTDTITGVQYAQKYTMTTEAIGAVFTGAVVTLAGGGASCTEDPGTGIYYCNYVLADDNAAGISTVLDGYVDDQATNLSTDRTANTDAQDAQTLSIKYSHKITTISTEALVDNIAGAGTTLTIGGDSCTWNAGDSTYYCAVALANDNVALSADVTLDGYVNASYGAVGNRVANTDAQSVDAITDVEYSHRVNTITTEQLLANIEGAGATLTIGGTACTWDGVTTAYYCPVTLANDDTAASAAVTLDGYVQASYGTVGNRTASGDAQSVDAITGVQYSHIVTTISTEVFADNIAGAGTTLTIGGDACTWNAGNTTYYCAVALANDDVAASAQATLDGYVQASFGTVANRTANADAQVTDTITGVQYAQKYTLTNEAFATVHTGSVVTLVGGTGACTEDPALNGVYYCDYTIGTDGGDISNVLDGYVDDQALNTSTGRAAHTDAQEAQSLTIKYSHKITTISTEALIDNIAADVTSLTVGGDTCTWHAGTTAWYCVTLLANDNVALSAAVTLDGYVNASYGAVGNRVANTDAQSVDAITDVEYSHRVNTITTEQLLANIEGAGTTLTIGGTACTWDGVTTAYYCPVTLAGDDTAASAAVTLDGYVQASYGTVGDRTASGDAQSVDAITGVQYSHIVTTISTEVFATNIAGAGTTLTIGGDACTWFAFNSTYYCAVALANDDVAASAQATLDGYVQASFGTVANRTANADAQVTDTITGVQYAQKYTMTTEAIGAVFTGAVVTLAGGGASCTEDPGTGVYYCNYVLADDNAAGISTVLDGYVDDQATNLSTDRTANTDAQDAQTLSIKYSHKITTISTEALVDNIAGAGTTLTIGGDSCTWNAGDSTYYCAVALANDNVALSADVTLDGYVNASYGAVGNRVANTDAQSVDAITDVEYSHRVNTITTEQLLANIEGAGATLTIGGTACTWDGVTTAYYCPVTLAGDDVALSAAVTLDGYVQASYGTVGNRAANGDAQSVDAITDVQYSHIVTTISTEVLTANIAGAGTTLTIGGDACTWNAGDSTYYCAVALANDDVAASADVTLDGYVEASYGAVANRTANSDAQVTDTITTVLYGQKYTLTNEAFATAHTGSAVTLVGGTGACTEDPALNGVYYCNYTIGTDGGDISNVLDGFVDDQALNTSTGRALNTDAQEAQSLTIKYGQKYTLTKEAFGTAYTGALVTLAGGTGACTESGAGTGIYYCNYTVGTDGGGVSTVLDGYVDDPAANISTGRALHTDAQDAQAFVIDYAYTITAFSDEQTANNITASVTAVTCGDDTAQNTCALNAATWYCPVGLANSDGTMVCTPTVDGYVQAGYNMVTGNNRAAHTTAQQTDTIADILYAYKVTAITDEIAGALAGVTVTAGDAAAIACTESGGAWYCPVPLAHTTITISAALNGYVTNTTNSFASDRTAASDAQGTATVSNVLFAIKLTSPVQDELGNSVALDGAETLAFFTDSNCTAAAAAPVAGPTWNAGTTAWYIAQDPGTYYARLTKTGYVNSCDATSIVAAAAGPQVSPTYLMAGADGLKYGLKVAVYDQFGSAVTDVTATHGGSAPLFADQGAGANIYYFDTAAVAAQLLLTKTGYQSIDSGAANVTPGGGAVAQTLITLTGDTNGDITTKVPIAGGTSTIANGLYVAYNVQLTVQNHLGAGITGLGSLSNFFFLDGTATRVVPEFFAEVDPVNLPGEYQFKVDISSVTVQVKGVDDDADAWIDYEDSTAVSLAGIDATLQDFGIATVYPLADHILVTAADGTLETGNTEDLTITIYDNDGAVITAGPNATRQVTLTLAGGSAAPASQKDITATTLNSATSVAGAADVSVTGDLAGAGTALVTLTDSVVGDGADITAAAIVTAGALPQNFASSTTALPIDVVSSAATKIVVVNPADTSVDMIAPVTFQVQDANNNLVTSDNATSFTVNLTGSAVGVTATTGTVLSGGNSSTVALQVAGGQAVLSVRDTNDENVTITLTDTFGSALDVTSSQDILFSPGAATQIILTDPSNATVGANTNVTATVQDQYGNTVATSTHYFSIVAGGSATFGAAATTGTLVGGANSNTASVRAAGGIVTLPLTDTVAETVALSLSDSSATGLAVTSAQNVLFSAGTANKIVFTSSAQTLTAGTESASAFAIAVQDTYGNSAAVTASLSLSSSSTGTVTFSATSGGAAVTSLSLAAAATATFYYTDTKAGFPTITVSGTGLTSGTLQNTVNPAAAVTGVTITTAQQTDATQPTGQSSVQTATGLGGSLAIVTYPYTSSSSTDLQITADGAARGKVTVTVMDTYGNLRSGDTVSLIGSGLTGLVISPASATSDAGGAAAFDVSSTAVGTANIQARLGAVNYGSAFDVLFRSDDRTPPEIDAQSSAYSLVDGDMISASEGVTILVNLSDTGADASGVDLTSVTISVTDSMGVAVSGVTSTAGCASGTNCSVRWTPAGTLPAGAYRVTLQVQDNNGNVQTEEWSVRVTGGTQLTDIAAGPTDGSGVFNPMAGGSMKISFQAPSSGTATLEVYRRDGRMVFSTATAVTPGYNEILWNGLNVSGGFIANGVYVFRLRADLATGTTEQTGKLAIFKK